MYLLSVPVCAFQMVCLQVIGESLSSRGSAGIICLFCPQFLHMFVYLFTAIPLVLKRKTQMSEDLSLLKLIIYNLFRVLHRLLHQGLCNSGRSFPNGNPFPDLPEGQEVWICPTCLRWKESLKSSALPSCKQSWMQEKDAITTITTLVTALKGR